VPVANVLAQTGAFRLVQRIRGRMGAAETRQAPVARVSVDEFEANLLAIARMARADGARVICLTVPVRDTVPLVENFRAIDYDEGGRPRRTWMRQIDFAVRLLGPDRGAEVRKYFRDSSASLAAFGGDRRACGEVRDLAARYPTLAIFPYLVASCAAAARDLPAARQALAAVEAADSERRELEAYNTRLRELAAQFPLELVDVASVFRSHGSHQLLSDVVHPTPAGHALIAETLAEHLTRPH